MYMYVVRLRYINFYLLYMYMYTIYMYHICFDYIHIGISFSSDLHQPISSNCACSQCKFSLVLRLSTSSLCSMLKFYVKVIIHAM